MSVSQKHGDLSRGGPAAGGGGRGEESLGGQPGRLQLAVHFIWDVPGQPVQWRPVGDSCAVLGGPGREIGLRGEV